MDGVRSSAAALTSQLGRQSADLRAALARATSEVTTGQVADLGAALRGDHSGLAALDHSLARLRGHQTATTEVGLMATAMQAALGVVSDQAETLSLDLLKQDGLQGSGQLPALASEAGRRLDTVLAALNTQVADRAIFGGTQAGTAPLPASQVLLSALDAAVAGALTVADVETAIAGWFAAPTGFAALYVGGPARAPLPIAPGEAAVLDVTALDPGLQDTVRQIATVAMLGRGVLAGQPDAQATLARRTGEALLTSGSDRAALAARIGTEEARIAGAQARNAAEASSLDIARAGLVAADPYDAATRLQEVQTRLESVYMLTARLSRLTLTEYLR